jgi:carboxypeptidase Q
VLRDIEGEKVLGQGILRWLLLAAGVLLSAAIGHAQIPPVKPAPLSSLPSSPHACAIEKSCADVAPAMIRSAVGISPLEENLRYLTDAIGGRLTGSPRADRAVRWSVEALRRSGVDEVHTERFTVPVGWSEGQTHGNVLSPEPFRLRLVSTGWSPPTPEGGITADIVDVGPGDDAGFAKTGASANGAILLVHTNVFLTVENLSNESMVEPAIVDRAIKAGGAGIFWMSSQPNLLLYRHTLTLTGGLEPLPQAIVAREDAARIARFLASGQRVRVHFDMPNHVRGPVESENVVAEIRGREKADEFVLLGAHLDSWELGTGALDNGCNAAVVIDAARAIRATGAIPRRSIRFALFTGEEQGMLGSWAYARGHRAELDHMVAAIILDEGTGHVTGYSLGGRSDILAAVREALDPLQSLGVKEFTLHAEVRTDNLDFLLEGVPTLVGDQEPANYVVNDHAASDTFDKVDIAALKGNVAIASVTAYALADGEQRIGPRQSRAEIEQLIKETRLDRQMKREGFWPMWEKGDRGRRR